jgi:hypothetical protein
MVTGRKDGGLIKGFAEGGIARLSGGTGKFWGLSNLWGSSGAENLFVNQLSQNEKLLAKVMDEVNSSDISNFSKQKILSTVPFNLNPKNDKNFPTVEQDFSSVLKSMFDKGMFDEHATPDFLARLFGTIEMPNYRQSFSPLLSDIYVGPEPTIEQLTTSNRAAPSWVKKIAQSSASDTLGIEQGYELDRRTMAREIVNKLGLGYSKSILKDIEDRLANSYLRTHTAHGFANGSYVSGSGGPKSDMIPAMLSNGEYVVNADAVKHYGVGFVDAINSRKFASGGIARFADGTGNKNQNQSDFMSNLLNMYSMYQMYQQGQQEKQKPGTIDTRPSTKGYGIDPNIAKEAVARSDQVKALKESTRSLKEHTGSFGKLGQGIKSITSGLGEKFKGGGGFGLMIGAQMLSGVASVATSNMEQQAGGQTAMSGAIGGASNGMSMGSMVGSFFGPEGTAIGAGVGALGGAIIGAIQGKMAEDQRNLTAAIEDAHQKTLGYATSLTTTNDTLSMVGVQMKTLNTIDLGNGTQEASAFATAVNELAGALKNGSDGTKAMIKTISGANPDQQKKMLADQFYGVLAAGGSKEKAMALAAAVGQDAGMSNLQISNIVNSLGDMASQQKNLQQYGAYQQFANGIKGSEIGLDKYQTAMASIIPTSVQNAVRAAGGRGGAMVAMNQERGTYNTNIANALGYTGQQLGEGFMLSSLKDIKGKSASDIGATGLGGGDALGSSDSTVKSISILAGVTKQMKPEEVEAKVNKYLQALNGMGDEVFKGAQKLQDAYGVVKSNFTDPLANDMATIKDSAQFHKVLSEAMTQAGSAANTVAQQLADQFDPTMSQMAKTFLDAGGKAENLINALYAIQGINFSSDQARTNAAALASNPAVASIASAQGATNSRISTDSSNLVDAITNIPQTTAADLQKQANQAQKDAAAQTKAIEKNAQAEVKNIDNQIKAKNKYIESIKKEMEARQKLYDKKQQQMQQDLTLQNLQNSISKARNSGDLLGMALAQSQYNDELDRQAELNKKNAADAADQKKINAAGNQIQSLQDQAQKIQDAASAAAQSIQDAAAATQDRIQKRIDGLAAEQKKYQDMAANVQVDLKTWTTLLESGQGDTKAGKDAKKALDDIISKLPDGARTAAQAQEKAITDEWAKFASTNKFMLNANGTLSSLGVQKGTISFVNGQAIFTPSGGSDTITIGGTSYSTSGDSRPQQASSGGGRTVSAFAQGGPIYGPGTKTSDSVPAMLSHGEYVIKASSVDKYGTGFLNQVNTGKYADGGEVGAIKGGGSSASSPKSVNSNPVGYASALNRALSEIMNPSESWAGLCQKLARTIAGAGAWAGSALKAWNAIPKQHQHGGTPPGGAIAYWGNNEPGHATWIAGRKTDGKTYAVSNDILRKGKADMVPWDIFKSAWGLNYRGWIDWTPSGKLPLGGNITGQASNFVMTPSDSSGTSAGGPITQAQMDTIIASIKNTVIPMQGQMSFANGGLVTGPGTGRSDSIFARLSKGEYVVNANATSKYGTDLLAALNAGSLNPTFQNPAKRVTVSTQGGESISNRSTSNIQYNVNVNVEGSNASPQEIARVVINTIKQREKSNVANRRIG